SRSRPLQVLATRADAIPIARLYRATRLGTQRVDRAVHGTPHCPTQGRAALIGQHAHVGNPTGSAIPAHHELTDQVRAHQQLRTGLDRQIVGPALALVPARFETPSPAGWAVKSHAPLRSSSNVRDRAAFGKRPATARPAELARASRTGYDRAIRARSP